MAVRVGSSGSTRNWAALSLMSLSRKPGGTVVRINPNVIDAKRITLYCAIVPGEASLRANSLKDLFAGIRALVRGQGTGMLMVSASGTAVVVKLGRLVFAYLGLGTSDPQRSRCGACRARRCFNRTSPSWRPPTASPCTRASPPVPMNGRRSSGCAAASPGRPSPSGGSPSQTDPLSGVPSIEG